jgi:glycosyltransferase involved in cell wall biosynthesis
MGGPLPAATSLARSGAAEPRTKVLHIVNAMEIGGLQRVVETLCEATDRDRFDVRVLCLGVVGLIGDEMRGRGFQVDGLPDSDPERPDRLAAWKVYQYLKADPVDVVHTHNTQAMIEGIAPAFAARVPIRIHTDHARLYPDRQAYILAERVLSRLTSAVVAVSDHTATQLRTYQKISERRLVTIPNGIDASAFIGSFDVVAKRKELGLPATGPVIGLAARLAEQKGIIHLLEAMPLLLNRFPDLHLLIAGEGELEDSLKESAAELGIEAHTHFLGPRRDIPELYAVMDLFMLPSYWEGLPMALLEAMAAGLPTVGCDVGGVATAVKEGVNGMLVEPGRPDDLAEATIEMLSDLNRLSDYGQAAAKLFQEKFSAEPMARAYEDLYLGRRV